VATVKIDDGDPRFSWLAEGNAKQARKRVAAKVIIRDQIGCILLVDPTYKEYWDLPGGMVEANESPRMAAEREIFEELGFRVKIGHLLGIDWIGAHGPWDDQLLFVFDGGIIADAAIKELRIVDREISEFGLFSACNASRLLRRDVAQRLMRAIDSLDTGHASYIEHQNVDHTE
jgi:8-oxo-dGTP pyrophosphatase MutT (NUDIX family)